MKQITPCLWFDNQAEEASKFYTTLFENSKIKHIARYSKSGSEVSGQKKDSVMTVEFELEGQTFVGLNGGPIFKFSPAVSFFVWRNSEKEIDHLWKNLSQGGKVLWELKKYPWSEKYGWCIDKYGVPWQLMLSDKKKKISPAFLFMDTLFGKGEEAIQYYISQFEKSKIEEINYDPKSKTVLHATFSLNGNEFVLMEGQGDSNYSITPAISFMIYCKDQAEVDLYWNKLSQNGSIENCGWLKDKYGVSWQIIPQDLGKLMSDSNGEKVERVMKTMLKMKKLDINELWKAYNA